MSQRDNKRPITNLRSRALIGALLGGFASLVVAQEAPTGSEVSAVSWPTIRPDEVQRGQKGYGLSVFAGSEPERFEVEVLGVIQQSTPELSYILARLSGQDLERSGVIAGMSGSPVYLDGRLAGAVAFSYLYGLDAIAGITPIDAMRRLTELPVGTPPAKASASGPRAIDFESLLKRDFSAETLSAHLELLRPPVRQGASATIQWTASGFGDGASTLLRNNLGQLTPAGILAGAATTSGGGEGVSTSELVPGSSVAAVLVRGDLNLAAHGTVTDRQGDELVAFGHPVFSLGPINLPMAPSDVVTVIANVANSFKISNAGEAIGVFDQDREAGVRGRIGAVAPMTPLTVRLSGLTERQYDMEVADIPPLRPVLFAISTLGALTSGSYSGGSQGIDLRARIGLAGRDDLEIKQSFDGDQAAIDSVIYLLSFAAFLELNPMAEVDIESIEVDIDQVDRPRSARLLAAHPDRTRVEPGQSVGVTVDLVPYRGTRQRHRVNVPIPETVPDGRYTVLLGDGTSMDAVRLAFEQRQPASFDQALDLMSSFRSRRELTVLGVIPRTGLAVAGDVLPDLPGSVRSIFSAGSGGTGSPLTWHILEETVETLKQPIDGVLRIDLEVRRQPNG